MKNKRVCPICGRELEEKEVKDYMGRSFYVDICPFGCGIWFDKWEILKAKEECIQQIDSKENYFNVQKRERFCPVCKKLMKTYYNPSYKLDFEIDYCLFCNGMWFDRGEAIKFKNLQREKLNKLKRETEISPAPIKGFYKAVREEEAADDAINAFLWILRFIFRIPF